MPSNKEHHYVPQFYLRNFSENRKVVRAFNIARRLHIPHASIRGQCHRAYLYGDGTAVLEARLADLERAVSVVVQRILSDGLMPSDLTDRGRLFAFVAAQWGRTPTAARLHNLFLTKTYRAVARSSERFGNFGASVNELVVEQPDAILDTTVNSVRYSVALGDLRMKVVRNASAIEFITSDAPVAFHNQWAQQTPGVGTIGYACSGLQVILPLDARHVLVLYDAEIYRVGTPKDDIVTTSDERFVRQMNALQAVHAEENVYYRAAAMAAHVDGLPWQLRRAPDEAVRAERYAEEGGGSMLISTFQQMSRVKLSSPVISVHPKMEKVSVFERAQRWRPVSSLIFDRIRAEHLPHSDGRPPPEAAGRSFRHVIED